MLSFPQSVPSLDNIIQIGVLGIQILDYKSLMAAYLSNRWSLSEELNIAVRAMHCTKLYVHSGKYTIIFYQLGNRHFYLQNMKLRDAPGLDIGATSKIRWAGNFQNLAFYVKNDCTAKVWFSLQWGSQRTDRKI